ncbi:alkaline ceramidase ydc1 [Paecilomyces lecythidis]|uniref:Alkaline ceramidase ydc1 n=1 Tax=Paecilomyces lecythidis TaxID=3004212 RepID=A0ABR3XQC7_9EURO
MHFAASIISLVGLAAPLAFAASCFPQGGCGSCASFQQLEDLKNNFCATKSNIANTPEQFNGQAHVQVFGGPIGSESLCQQAFDNIVDDCFTKKDGGDFNFNG